ncbi:DUF1385 domain-containing protein, partial [Candidatus Bathyarchaeota archaeon]|nr:DUF1385 domain-containing protein [Candidatus Bathyarchaeota archaeon]
TRLSYRIVLVPVISAVSYELLKLSDRYKESIVIKTLVAPGLFLQRFTTREPNDKMLEVAIEALKTVEKIQKNQ